MDLRIPIQGPFADADTASTNDRRITVVSYKVKIKYRCGTREGVDFVPLYLVPLLARKYELSGGRVEVSGEWQVSIHKERTIKRQIGLTAQEWSNELIMMTQQFVVAMPGGQRHIFEDVYGKNGEKLITVLPEQTKRFKALLDLCLTQNRQPSDAEVREIALYPIDGAGDVRSLAMAQGIDMDAPEPQKVQASPFNDEAPDTKIPATADPILAALLKQSVPERVAQEVAAIFTRDKKIAGPELMKVKVIADALKKDESLMGRIFAAIAG